MNNQLDTGRTADFGEIKVTVQPVDRRVTQSRVVQAQGASIRVLKNEDEHQQTPKRPCVDEGEYTNSSCALVPKSSPILS